MITLPKILPEPKLPKTLPSTAKWLAGEAAGSWFVIEKDKDLVYKISRFSPEGTLECESAFKSEKAVNLQENFTITYPSHCAIVTIIQRNLMVRFTAIKEPKISHNELYQPVR